MDYKVEFTKWDDDTTFYIWVWATSEEEAIQIATYKIMNMTYGIEIVEVDK